MCTCTSHSCMLHATLTIICTMPIVVCGIVTAKMIIIIITLILMFAPSHMCACHVLQLHMLVQPTCSRAFGMVCGCAHVLLTSARFKIVQTVQVRSGSKKFCQGSAGPEPKNVRSWPPWYTWAPTMTKCAQNMPPMRQKLSRRNHSKVISFKI